MNPGTTGSYFCDFCWWRKLVNCLDSLTWLKLHHKYRPRGWVQSRKNVSKVESVNIMSSNVIWWIKSIYIIYIYIYTYLFFRIQRLNCGKPTICHCTGTNNTQVWGSLIRKGTRTTYTILSTKDANEPHTRLTTLFLQPKCNMTIVVPDPGGWDFYATCAN